MTAGRYVEAVILGLLTIGSLGVTAVCLRRTLASSMSGAAARLAEIVIAVATVVLVAEVMGTIGLLRAVPLVAVLAAVSLLAFGLFKFGLVRRASRSADHSAVVVRTRREAWWEPTAAVLAVATVIGEWAPGTIEAMRHGLNGTDTYWYHMPISAQFAQSGTVVPLHNINNDNTIAFYPMTSELLHAVGILIVGSDFLTPLLTLFWLALALLAAWCLGSRYGVGSLSIVATAMVLGTQAMILSQPGTAYDDIVGIALALAALALLAHVGGLWNSAGELQSLWVAALAAGLAVGVKDTFLISIVTMTIGVIVLLPRGRRMRSGLLWCLIVGGAGGFWYVRNALYAANPFPNIRLGVGSFQLPTSPGTIGPTLREFIFDQSDWSKYFLPGLHQALGPAWWAIIAITVAGVVGGIVAAAWRLQGSLSRGSDKEVVEQNRSTLGSESAMAALLSFVALGTLVGYLFTPQPALPLTFVYDFRFCYLTLVCGAIALPIALARQRWVWLVLPTYGAVILSTQFGPGIWSTTTSDSHKVAQGLLAGLAVLVIGLVAVVLQTGLKRSLVQPALVLSVVLLGVAIGAGLPLENFYLTNWGAQGVYPVLARWASTLQDARIGISKGLILNYELYGSHLNNQVSFVGVAGPYGRSFDPSTCVEWREAINRARDEYVVIFDDLARSTPSSFTWTQKDRVAVPAWTTIVAAPDGFSKISVFRINGSMSPAGCRSTT